MALPIIDLALGHLSCLILSMFLVSYSLFCELIHSRFHFISRIPAGHARRHSSLVPEGIVSLIRTDGDWEDDITQEVAWCPSLCHVVELPPKSM